MDEPNAPDPKDVDVEAVVVPSAATAVAVSPFELVAGSGTPYTTTSSDSSVASSSTSSSSSEVEGDEGVAVVAPAFLDDEEDAGRLVRTYCRTDVEVDPDAVPMVLPYRAVDPGTVKKRLGAVTGFVSGRAVVQATAPLVDLDTPVCVESGVVVGAVEEVLGPVRAAYYSVRFLPEFAFSLDAPPDLYYALQEATKYVFPESLRDKGCDASREHDTAVPEEELDFSDDEAERAAAAARKAQRKNPAPGNSSAAPPPPKRRQAAQQQPQQQQQQHQPQRQYPYPPQPAHYAPSSNVFPQQQYGQQWPGQQWPAYYQQQPQHPQQQQQQHAPYPAAPLQWQPTMSIAQQQLEIQRTQAYLMSLMQMHPPPPPPPPRQ